MAKLIHGPLLPTFLALLSCPSAVLGQNSAQATSAVARTSVTRPISTGDVSKRDATALLELGQYAALIQSSYWTAMQGTGRLTFAGDDSKSYDATLSVLQQDKYRLDVKTDTGLTSLRINELIGNAQAADGALRALPIQTAMAGIFPFAIPQTMLARSKQASVRDQGLVIVDGAQLHKITYERTSLGFNPVTKATDTVLMDLYFDPTSHRLLMSTALLPLPRNVKSGLLSTIRYEDYRQVDGAVLPFRFVETLEGQQYQTLQLSTITLNPALDVSDFAF